MISSSHNFHASLMTTSNPLIPQWLQNQKFFIKYVKTPRSSPIYHSTPARKHDPRLANNPKHAMKQRSQHHLENPHHLGLTAAAASSTRKRTRWMKLPSAENAGNVEAEKLACSEGRGLQDPRVVLGFRASPRQARERLKICAAHNGRLFPRRSFDLFFWGF